jgi:hypothetical protein
VAPVTCPLCGRRKARRACPAIRQSICAVCCGTKRLVEIQCLSDCSYLAAAREHPAAVTVRQQGRDITILSQLLRDLGERQSRLALLINRFLIQYPPADLQPLVDDDVAEAAGALAATFETASRGVIYEHRPTSLPAERLLTGLKAVLAEAVPGGGTPFERDAAAVLRRIEQAVRDTRANDAANRRAYLDMLGRVLAGPATPDAAGLAAEEPSRLILP